MLRVLAVSVVLLISTSVFAQTVPPDELRLLDGRALSGKAVEFDGKSVVFRTDAGLATYQRAECSMLIFGQLAAASGAIPPGVSAIAPLNIRKWATWRQITHWPSSDANPQVWGVRMSADGSRIALSSWKGLFTMKSDGTAFVKVVEGRVPILDISADGKRVAYWLEGKGLFVANGDGTDIFQLPGGFNVISLRITADGRKVIVLSPDRGLLEVMADGSGIRRIVGIAEAAKASGADENGNHWRGGGRGSDFSGIDISDDGSHIVFQYLWNAIAVNGDGTGIRNVTQLVGDDRRLHSTRVSGNGQKLAYLCNASSGNELIIENWDGTGRVIHKGRHVSDINWFEMTRDGSQALASWGVRYFGADGRYYDPFATPAGLDPLPRMQRASCTADGKRGCFVIEGPTAQSEVVTYELKPATLNGAPALADIRVVPHFVLNDSTSVSVLTTRPTGGEEITVAHALFRDGFTFIGDTGDIQFHLWPKLNDNAENGDQTKGDGLFTSGIVKLQYNNPKPPLPAGPLQLRVTGWNKANCGLTVDMDGMEARNP